MIRLRTAAGLILLALAAVLLPTPAPALEAPRIDSIMCDKAAKDVVLTWVPVLGATQYKVLRSEKSGADYREVSSQWYHQRETLRPISAHDFLARRGTRYYYLLRAMADDDGYTDSKEVEFLTPGVKFAESPPKWETVQYSPASRKVRLSWLPVVDATSYQVLRSENPGAADKVIFARTRFLEHTSSLEPGKRYYFVVRAVSGDEVGADSEEKEIVTPPKSEAVPPEWDKIAVQSSPEFGKVITRVGLFWKASPDTISYQVLRSETPGKNYVQIASVQETQYIDTTALEGKTYYYVFFATDSSFQDSKYSEERTVKIEGYRPAKMMKMKYSSEERQASAPAPAPALRGWSGSPPPATAMDAARLAGSKEFDELVVIRKSPKPGEGQGRMDNSLADRETPRVPGFEYGEIPGSGELRALLSGERRVMLPLKHTEVAADVYGYISTVKVTQQYQNPYEEKIEAVYIFPLPENGAVSDFVMVIGERRIRGVIREREEAERIYDEARRQGLVASLLTQERPNIFTQKVANIEPGRSIDIEVTYFNTLAYEDGEYVFTFPMVVGPRYNPAGSTQGVGAVARGAAGISGQATEVQYLRPDERSGHDIMVTLKIDAGVPIEQIESPSHAVDVRRKGRNLADIRLKPADTLPNKDLVVRYRVAGKTTQYALMTEQGKKGGYFTLMLQPPGNLGDLPRTGQEIVFLLDTSGSMSGWPIEKCKAAARRALRNLDPDDTFQIVRFAGDASTFAPAPVAANPENIEAALRYLDTLAGSGGTEMLRGIRAALDFPHDEERLRTVAFMTDGFIGNEEQILGAVAEKLGPSRIFSFGIGNSVNRYLMEGLARIGRGTVAYVLTGDSDTGAVDSFFERIRHPALTDVTIDWGGLDVSDVYPRTIPDIFVGRPLTISGRFAGHGDVTIRVSGRVGGKKQSFRLTAALDEPDAARKGIGKIWARARIADLSDDAVTMTRSNNLGGLRDLQGEIKQVALDHGLLSQFTAFVAVDSSRVTAGDHGTTVNVPVPVPDGVRYDTTVEER